MLQLTVTIIMSADAGALTPCFVNLRRCESGSPDLNDNADKGCRSQMPIGGSYIGENSDRIEIVLWKRAVSNLKRNRVVDL